MKDYRDEVIDGNFCKEELQKCKYLNTYSTERVLKKSEKNCLSNV